MSDAGPITKDTIIEEIIQKYPKSLGVLVGYGIDCCCGANEPLEEGALAPRVDLQRLLEELNSIALPVEAK